MLGIVSSEWRPDQGKRCRLCEKDQKNRMIRSTWWSRCGSTRAMRLAWWKHSVTKVGSWFCARSRLESARSVTLMTLYRWANKCLTSRLFVKLSEMSNKIALLLESLLTNMTFETQNFDFFLLWPLGHWYFWWLFAFTLFIHKRISVQLWTRDVFISWFLIA